jgi:hypothetical protein
MVKRNLNLSYEFVCFTECAKGLDKDIRVEPLSQIEGVHGWWYKPMFFNPNLPIKGTILFLDLDLIIFRNIDHLFTHNPGRLQVIRDFNRKVIKNYPKFNSSVVRFDTGKHRQVYTEFMKNPADVCRRFLGDQDWLYHQVKSDFDYWPEEWIQSYKWEMRNRPALDRSRAKGARDFTENAEPTVLPGTSIAVFHGDPNPHICKDEWVWQNWY